MDDAKTILGIAEQLHAAALEPDRWAPALAAIMELMRGDHAIIHASQSDVFGSGFQAAFRASAGLGPGDEARFWSAEAAQLAAKLPGLPLNVAFASTQVYSDDAFERSGYYNEIIRPTGAFFASSFLRVSPAQTIAFSTCRPRRGGAYEGEEVARLQALQAHISTAAELHCRLHTAEQRSESLTHIVDRLDTGVILADAAARPCFVNALATRIAAARDGLAVEEDGLAATTAAATRHLRAAIAAMAADNATGSRRMHLERPSRRPPLVLTLLPIGRLRAAVPGMRMPRVAVFISEPDAPGAINREAVADTFRLTRRESEIAALLASGHDLGEAAGMLGLGIGTARHHLKRVFEKTGVHSQVKLVALLRGFVNPGA